MNQLFNRGSLVSFFNYVKSVFTWKEGDYELACGLVPTKPTKKEPRYKGSKKEWAAALDWLLTQQFGEEELQGYTTTEALMENSKEYRRNVLLYEEPLLGQYLPYAEESLAARKLDLRKLRAKLLRRYRLRKA